MSDIKDFSFVEGYIGRGEDLKQCGRSCGGKGAHFVPDMRNTMSGAQIGILHI